MTCSICAADASPYCLTKVLGKYDVQYYRCSRCQFIFTESPYWLDEAYESAITRLDIGLIHRNQLMTPVVKAVISKWFNPQARFIDYGGGYGMLVRMMRDQGFDFYRQDIHCTNLYAESFDVTDLPPFRAELVTAFEVFEHLINPAEELEKILVLSDTVLFSTLVQPTNNVTPDSWWYFTPETGQHVSLYSRTSLQALANRFQLYYCWNDLDMHVFSRKPISNRLFRLITHPRWCLWYDALISKRPTLLWKDFDVIRSQLNVGFHKK